MPHPISPLALISVTLLSSHKVLNLLQEQPFAQPLQESNLREAVYLTYQAWAAREPDHVFHRNWLMLGQQTADRGGSRWLPGALQALATEFLCPRHGALYVRLEKYGVWQQSLVSRICSLPVQAAGYTWPPESTYLQGLNPPNWLRSPDAGMWASVHLPTLTPYDPLVEDYLLREGVHETHLHLNGSTHAEQCWLRALRAPQKETADFERKWHDGDSDACRRVRELARSVNPALNPAELRRQLIVARRLREWLVAAATEAIPADMELPSSYTVLSSDQGSDKSAPAPADVRLGLHSGSSSADEMGWLSLLLRRLDEGPERGGALDRMLHCYLVLQNQYYRLLVQSEEQFGFDQFQKFTWTDLREPAEKEYLVRFLSMHGRHARQSRVGYLEGRFAPKGSLGKNEELLRNILGGYLRYLRREQGVGDSEASPAMTALLDQLHKESDTWLPQERHHFRLGLVAHFIKQPWDNKGANAGSYRFYGLRQDLEEKAHVLIQTLATWPHLHRWLRGIDAAANELHASPEVFASCYRICRQAGLTRRSYHAGEDFPHLLSGLRQMLDALELLDLRDGDRIGHGTAMGISPRLWLSRMPDELVVRRGDWMLDLLAAWRLLRSKGATEQAYRVECELAALASQLFDEDLDCTALERAMSFRGLHLGYLQNAQESTWQPRIDDKHWLHPVSNLQHAEAMLVFKAMGKHRRDLARLWKWQSDQSLWQRSEALIHVKAGYFDAAGYLCLQQALMDEVAKRRVLIETLPASNVRISQYQDFNEHHAFRWMRVPGFTQPGDPPIMVTLGSDDPGIFAGDLNSEFYLLYATLRGTGLGDKEALNYLAPVNERGRQYRFHDLSIG